MMKPLLLILFSLIAYNVLSQDQLAGKWAGQVIYSQAKVPFEMELQKTDQGFQAIFVNGNERIIQKDVTVFNDSLNIRLSPFDVELKASWDDSRIQGRWVKHYRNSKGVEFIAVKNGSRFETGNKKPASITKELKISLKSANGSPYSGLSLFEQEGEKLEGTIITGTGDLRYFSGIMDGDSLKMSSFDGAHGFLLKGVKKKGKWSGELVFDNGYNEYWQETEEGFDLKPAFETIDLEEGKSEPFFDILAAGDGHQKYQKEDFEGKVSIIQLLGSWCPNSLDETRYLTRWFEENEDLDVQIMAVFYEINYSPEYATRRIEDYKKDNNISYQTAIGGRANKGQAALAFPFMNKIDAFPTLVILDKKGHARYVHNYFEGPATGKRYQKFDERFREIIAELVAE